MGRTITLELHPEVVERLHACALAFRPLFGRSDRFNQGRIFLYGLLVDGERKSIEPLSRRVLGGDDQRLQQFVNQSPWDPAPVLAAYRARLAAEFAWVRVWPAHRWQDGVPAEAIPDPAEAARWLLVEQRPHGTIKQALSNLPPATTLEWAVGWWKERWQVERGSLQLKDERGLDHFGGRSRNGFHHHATMAFLAYGFPALERQRAATEPPVGVEPQGEALRGA